ncbi:MAG: thioredoxin domain-containing protein [Candidatus Pacebacteria bacterium]|nr:thioredoxin domain-containing protein [Candidatus Paceibacterota bacterium]
MESNQEPRQILTIPMAIVLAAVIIAGALLYMYRPAATAQPAANNQTAPTATVPSTASLPPVTAADHILGNPNAPIKIVEYSDPSCPYCKMFQTTMLQIMQTYGAGGQVAWIYRDFPLDKPDQNGNVLHPNAGAQANAFECAASVGGNAGFWAFEKDWYSTFPQNGADETSVADNQQIMQVAKDVKLDTGAFSDCVLGNKMTKTLDKEYADGLALGIDGTPTSYIVSSTGQPIAVQGAQPYATLKAAIDAILGSTGQNTSSASAATTTQ